MQTNGGNELSNAAAPSTGEKSVLSNDKVASSNEERQSPSALTVLQEVARRSGAGYLNIYPKIEGNP